MVLPRASRLFMYEVTSNPDTGTGSALEEDRIIEAKHNRKKSLWEPGMATARIVLRIRARSTTTYFRNQ